MQLNTQLLAIITAFITGEFILRSDRLIELKSSKWKWSMLYVLELSFITWLFLGNLSLWWTAVIVLIAYMLVELLVRVVCTITRRKGFTDISNRLTVSAGFWLEIGKLFLYSLAITGLWLCLSRKNVFAIQRNYWEILFGDYFRKGLVMLTGLGLGAFGVGYVVKYHISIFITEMGDHVKHGLQKGGRTIGILERILVLMFVLAGKPEGVGFIIAAKSVFRIGELTNRDERQHAEYIMIGTLLSFTYALAFAFLTKWAVGKM